MRTLLILGTLALSSPVWAAAEATVEEAVVEQTVPCLNVMPQVDAADWAVTIAVQFDDGGQVKDADAVSYAPQNETGKQAVRDVLRALTRCGPYAAKEQTLNLHFGPTLTAPIDPFKKSGG